MAKKSKKKRKLKRDRARYECVSTAHKRKYYFTTEYAYKRHMRTWHGIMDAQTKKKETGLTGFHSFR